MDQHRCVFVVESDPETTGALVAYLRAEGFIPCMFTDGRVAVAAVRNDTPAAVIVDIGWLGIRGVTICDAVRNESAVPILLLTGCIEEVEMLRRIDCRVDGYVCKPFGPREVIAQLQEVIRRARERTSCTAEATGRSFVNPLGPPPHRQHTRRVMQRV